MLEDTTCLGHGDDSAAPPTEEELLSEFALELADVPNRTLVEVYLEPVGSSLYGGPMSSFVVPLHVLLMENVMRVRLSIGNVVVGSLCSLKDHPMIDRRTFMATRPFAMMLPASPATGVVDSRRVPAHYADPRVSAGWVQP
jgi:hypothetical protein